MFNFKTSRQEADPVAAFHSRMLAAAGARGKSCGEQGLPRATEDILNAYTGGFTADYESEQAQVLKPYMGDQEGAVQADHDNLNQKSQQIERQLADKKEARRTLRLEKDNLAHNDYESHKTFGLWVVIVVLAVAEGIFSLPAFRLFDSSNNLFQYFLLIGLVAFFVFLPHAILGTFRATEDSRYKHPIRVVGAATILAGLYVVAIMRTAYLQNIGTTTMREVKAVSALPLNGWCFVALSLLFLTVTTYCAYLLPDRTQKKSNTRARQIDAKLRELDTEIGGLEREALEIPDRLRASRDRASRNQTEAESIRQRFSSMHAAAIHAFIESNRTHRTDRAYPTCYHDPIPSLKNIS